MVQPLVVDLHDERALDPLATGGKAAALARAASSGLATLPGVVLTTAFCDEIDAGAEIDSHPAVLEAFERASGERQPLVARSSSVVEDTADSSMAGQFESVIDIRGFDAFTVAVKRVLVSRERAGASDQPIAVLVQPLIEPTSGGVMFGIDPVTGRSDWRVISAVHGAPEQLVSGEVRGSRYLLEPNAKVIEFDANDGPQLAHADLRRLDRLSATRSPRSSAAHKTSSGRSRRTASCGCSSRDPSPPSSRVHRSDRSSVPGRSRRPFPSPSRSSSAISGSRRSVRRSARPWSSPARRRARRSTRATIVITVDGHVAIDLRLAGEIPPKHSVLQKLNPVPAVHHLRGSVARRPAPRRVAALGRAPARQRRRRSRSGPGARPSSRASSSPRCCIAAA